jgi:predicted O-methyltransferase YrrM
MDKFYRMRINEQIDGLDDLINYVGNTKEMSMIEIGSYIGESTLMFSDRFKSVLSIDPFIDNYDPDDLVNHYSSFDKVYQQFINNTKDNKNIHNIRMTSNDAYKELSGKLFDFIYIDGNHQYEFVKQDILNYKNLIKPGGFIAGHDYSDNWLGVIDAINETLGDVDKIFVDTSWIKQL